jgi:hypothetical protein
VPTPPIILGEGGADEAFKGIQEEIKKAGLHPPDATANKPFPVSLALKLALPG